MKILLLADIHSKAAWFRWIAKQNADLTVIAGDLLDGFSNEGLLSQKLLFSNWVARFPSLLALSSGNHDGNDSRVDVFDPHVLEGLSEQQRETAGSLLLANHWMDCLERPGVVTDRRSVLLETPGGPIVVTSVPFDFGSEGSLDSLWNQGAHLRKQHRARWVVLHHEPPADSMVGGQMGDPHLFDKIQDYRPNFVVSGHIHIQPYRGSFADKLGETWCFNPGHPAKEHIGPVPNHILLDLKAGTATWIASPKIKKTVYLAGPNRLIL